MSTKIEIRLAKAEIITWASLEHGKGPAVLLKPNVSTSLFYTFFFFYFHLMRGESLDIWNFGAEVSMRPAYPSSKKVKDWDKLEAEVKKQEKDEKLEGDAALNKFFREIYSNADEDMRRAMSKSFVSISLVFLMETTIALFF